MKKIVLTFGLISGAILVVMMSVTMLLVDNVSFEKLEVFGYTTMLVSFLMVFFGIRSYRETIGGGTISFGKALKVGFLITLISCLCYVIAWEIIYFKVWPDFAEKYGNHMIEKARAAGASAAELAAKKEQIESFKAIYNNPLFNAAITLLEPLPVAIPVTLISAALLRRKEPKSHSTRPNAATAQSK